MIVLITGDFGVGKDTFADMLLNHLGDKGKKVLSYATREPRFEGEDTHIFVSKEEWLNLDDKVAETLIGDNYYGTIRSQFGHVPFDIYIVDDIGVRDVYAADIDDIFLIEVVRPKWLIDVPESRLNRERTDSYDYYDKVDHRVLNDGGLEKLDGIAKDISMFLQSSN